ncbi:MAG: Lrp/AsnC family transcriptional regulator [Sphingopyxis sp.]|nr:Lrp/AsnC family transcriptional regulator [Sphingopyxis sp.]
MNKLDWKIIAELERDGRQSYAELGEHVGLSKSPCWSRVKNLEESGVIEGYAARLDPMALGLTVQSFVEVQIRFDAHTEFEAAVLAHPAIVECHTTAGESDYLLKIFSRSADHLDELLRHNLSKLPGVQRLKTVVCLKTIKRQGRLAEWARTTEGRGRPGQSFD